MVSGASFNSQKDNSSRIQKKFIPDPEKFIPDPGGLKKHRILDLVPLHCR
jgi:hypothetical protein